MAQPKLSANFFVSTKGIIYLKSAPLSFEQRRDIFNRDNGICQKCRTPVRFAGITNSAFSDLPPPCHVDHIFPRSRGGRTTPDNLQLLCITCNTRKGAKT